MRLSTPDIWNIAATAGFRFLMIAIATFHLSLPAVCRSQPKTGLKQGQLAGQNSTAAAAKTASASEGDAIAAQRPERPPLTNRLKMKFAYIPPGSFIMGSPKNEPGRDRDEASHRVNLTAGFYIQTTEVTVAQWRVFAEKTGYRTEAEKRGGAHFRRRSKWVQGPSVYWDNPGFPQTGTHPVTCISWNDAKAFIRWLGRWDGGVRYRLPSEAEWEYACRGGAQTSRFWGENPQDACRHANVHDTESEKENSGTRWRPHDCDDGHAFTAPVATFSPNGLGLYDMLGNVWEWCEDWYGLYPAMGYDDPSGPPAGMGRIIRGGGWDGAPRNIRAALRDKVLPERRSNDLGFRLVREE